MENEYIQWCNYVNQVHHRKVLLFYLATLPKKNKNDKTTGNNTVIFYFIIYYFFNTKLLFTGSKPRWRVKPFPKEARVHGRRHCLTSELQLTNLELYQNFV